MLSLVLMVYAKSQKRITPEMIDYMLEMRSSNRNKVEDMATKFPGKAKFIAGKKRLEHSC